VQSRWTTNWDDRRRPINSSACHAAERAQTGQPVLRNRFTRLRDDDLTAIFTVLLRTICGSPSRVSAAISQCFPCGPRVGSRVGAGPRSGVAPLVTTPASISLPCSDRMSNCSYRHSGRLSFQEAVQAECDQRGLQLVINNSLPALCL
jgi:hypothetical protein